MRHGGSATIVRYRFVGACAIGENMGSSGLWWSGTTSPRPIAQNSDSESFGGLLLFRLHFSDDGFRARPPRVHVHSASGKTLQHPQHFGRKFLKSSHAMTAALCGDVTNVPDAK